MKAQKPSIYLSHDEVWALLPWHANGSLDQAEADRLNHHLRDCLVCRRELAAQQTLAIGMQHAPPLEMSMKPSFDRLMSRIQAEATLKNEVDGMEQASIISVWRERLLDFLAPKRMAVALASLALLLTVAWLLPEISVPSGNQYHTVANPGSGAQYTRNDIRVVFADPRGEQAIGILLKAIDARIVDGPNAVGAYTIRIAEGEGSELTVFEAIRQLRESKQVVLAEPALPPIAD